jgi:hypothetical protein
MDDIAPRLVRRVLSFGPPGTFQAIIIDPIYKVNGGDDNDARAVARFTNTLDLVIMKCGCSVIYAHHHPKGATGNRKSIDRMSGSGVYGRDADTVLDFSPLFVPDATWERFERKPCYRAEVNCRSFAYRKPIDCTFTWPRFYRDDSGMLAECKILGEDPQAEGRTKGNQSNQKKATDDWGRKLDAVDDAYESYPKEMDRKTNCPRDLEELYEIVKWDAHGLEKPKLPSFKSWFYPSGKLFGHYEIGTVKTEVGPMKGCLIPKAE